MYCRVAQAIPGVNPELSCLVASGPRVEWTNGTSLYGELTGGYTIKVSTTDARKYVCVLDFIISRLIDPSCKILQTIGSQIPYECAIGVNGYVSD